MKTRLGREERSAEMAGETWELARLRQRRGLLINEMKTWKTQRMELARGSCLEGNWSGTRRKRWGRGRPRLRAGLERRKRRHHAGKKSAEEAVTPRMPEKKTKVAVIIPSAIRKYLYTHWPCASPQRITTYNCLLVHYFRWQCSTQQVCLHVH